MLFFSPCFVLFCCCQLFVFAATASPLRVPFVLAVRLRQREDLSGARQRGTRRRVRLHELLRDVGGQLRHRRPRLCLVRQRASAQLADGRRDRHLRRSREHGAQGAGHDLPGAVVRLVAVEGHAERDHLDHRHPEGVHVGRVGKGFLCPDLGGDEGKRARDVRLEHLVLRRRAARRPAPLTRHRVPRAHPAVAGRSRVREPKVGDLHAVALGDEDVRRLQVAVLHTLVVQVRHAARDADQPLELRLPGGHVALAQAPAEGALCAQLGDEVDGVLDAGAEQHEDVGVAQARHDVHLVPPVVLLTLLAARRARHVAEALRLAAAAATLRAAHDLHGDVRFLVLAAVHLGVAAHAEQLRGVDAEVAARQAQAAVDVLPAARLPQLRLLRVDEARGVRVRARAGERDAELVRARRRHARLPRPVALVAQAAGRGRRRRQRRREEQRDARLALALAAQLRHL
eukprot:Rhum_TRINITY_DN14233_c29_g1::Rhum_TRINITY_DN14233_c29_g1_i1::g.76340::m.76340